MVDFLQMLLNIKVINLNLNVGGILLHHKEGLIIKIGIKEDIIKVVNYYFQWQGINDRIS